MHTFLFYDNNNLHSYLRYPELQMWSVSGSGSESESDKSISNHNSHAELDFFFFFSHLSKE